MIRGSQVLDIWPPLVGAPPVIAEIGGVGQFPGLPRLFPEFR